MSIRDTQLSKRFAHVDRLRQEAGPYAKIMDFFALFKREDVYPSCLSCLQWDATGETCRKFQQRPPATIIVNSCGVDYEDEAEIPF